jgi:signal peptidase I
MLVNAIWTLRTAVRVFWLFVTFAVFGVMALSFALPALDRELYVVTGGSMEPTIPLGSAVVVRRAVVENIAPGDVITFRAANNAVVTHRVLDVEPSLPPQFHTKGDASATLDPFSVSAPSVIGNVEFVLPGAGALLVMMRTTVGALVTLGLIASLALTVWFMDELLITLRRSAARGAVLAEIT